MAIKSHYDTETQTYYVIKIHTLLTIALILTIRIIAQHCFSFLIERLHFNLDKREVMHNEETI